MAKSGVVVFVDGFPELSETFVVNEIRALERLGYAVRVEATWPVRVANPEGEGIRVDYQHGERRSEQARAFLRLVARRPGAVLADVRGCLRWRREEEVRPVWRLAPAVERLARQGGAHLHAHFAGTAALDAMRIARLAGVSYSVTTHAYDIFLLPRNLEEKLSRAAFHLTVCDYNAAALRALAPSAAARMHKVVMGVDPARFTRTAPYPAGRTILAIGRLVEKKGFAHLVTAAAALPDARVVIAGDGPLRDELAAAAGPNVELLGAVSPAEVRALLEQADTLAAPCVIAGDGDRDSMPVVVKEALAMGVPVVASDAVGLPEVVWPEWGRLVPPGDPGALAAALGEVLALAAGERIAMGRAGRDFVARACNVHIETARLAALIDAHAAGSASIQSSVLPQSERASEAGT